MWVACSVRKININPAMPIHTPFLSRKLGTVKNLCRLKLIPSLITGNGQYPHQLRALIMIEKIRTGHQTLQTTRFAGFFSCGPKSVKSISTRMNGTETICKPFGNMG
jgi:hypothetical protein